jgi:hypothetical protein
LRLHDIEAVVLPEEIARELGEHFIDDVEARLASPAFAE